MLLQVIYHKKVPFSYSLIILKKNSPGTEYASSACQTVVEAGLMGYGTKNCTILIHLISTSFPFQHFLTLVTRKYLTEYLPSEALLEPQLPRLGLSPISFVNFLTSKNFLITYLDNNEKLQPPFLPGFIFFATGILLSTVTFVFQDFLSNKHIRNY